VRPRAELLHPCFWAGNGSSKAIQKIWVIAPPRLAIRVSGQDSTPRTIRVSGQESLGTRVHGGARIASLKTAIRQPPASLPVMKNTQVSPRPTLREMPSAIGESAFSDLP
jgi:hypothetical protein